MYYHFGGKKSLHNDIHDNNAFFLGIMSIKVIKSSFHRSYDKQKIALVVISYEMLKACLINFI